jgi:hypothetical protein
MSQGNGLGIEGVVGLAFFAFILFWLGKLGLFLFGLAGLIVFVVLVPASLVILYMSKKQSSGKMKIVGFLMLTAAVVGPFVLGSADRSNGNEYNASATSGPSESNPTLEGATEAQSERYNDMSSEGQRYVDEQMAAYDKMCAGSSEC